MTLRQARCSFTQAIAMLIQYTILTGYEVALGEGLDRVTAKDPTTDHMKGSLHEIGLAQDIALYVNGNYQTETIDYTILGEWWEKLGVERGWPLAWGGRFKDGNHFSWAWEGKK